MNRREVLKSAGAATVGTTTLTGIASANPGNNPGKNVGSQQQDPGGQPFLEPTYDEIVFCGCTSVCIYEPPGDCGDVKILYTDGSTELVNANFDGPCFERGNIAGVLDDVESGPEYDTLVCNPNTACSGSDELDCDEVGTAPQFGGGGCG